MSNVSQAISITLDKAEDLVNVTISAGLVPMLKSAPGIGKSSFAKQLAERNNLCFMPRYVSTYDPTDFTGMPHIKEGRTCFAPNGSFPLDGLDTPPVKPEYMDKYLKAKAAGASESQLEQYRYDGWLILLDELSSASDAVQVAAYRLLLEREVGDNRLHPKAFLMAAGNGANHGAVASRFGTAMRSRLVHYNIVSSAKSFIEWGESAGIDSRILSFVDFRPQYVTDFNAKDHHDTFACGRTIEFLNKQLEFIPDPESGKWAPLYEGTVGPAFANEFRNYLKVYHKILTFTEIEADPTGVAIPLDKPDELFALADMVQSKLTVDNIDNLIKFISRMPIEHRVTILRRACARDKSLTTTKAVLDTIKAVAAMNAM